MANMSYIRQIYYSMIVYPEIAKLTFEKSLFPQHYPGKFKGKLGP